MTVIHTLSDTVTKNIRERSTEKLFENSLLPGCFKVPILHTPSYYKSSSTTLPQTKTNWVSITSKFPSTWLGGTLLFISIIPSSFQFHLSLDGFPNRAIPIENKRTVSLFFFEKLKININIIVRQTMDKLVSIGVIFEHLRNSWPVSFTPSDKNFLFRMVGFI